MTVYRCKTCGEEWRSPWHSPRSRFAELQTTNEKHKPGCKDAMPPRVEPEEDDDR